MFSFPQSSLSSSSQDHKIFWNPFKIPFKIFMKSPQSCRVSKLKSPNLFDHRSHLIPLTLWMNLLALSSARLLWPGQAFCVTVTRTIWTIQVPVWPEHFRSDYSLNIRLNSLLPCHTFLWYDEKQPRQHSISSPLLVCYSISYVPLSQARIQEVAFKSDRNVALNYN